MHGLAQTVARDVAAWGVPVDSDAMRDRAWRPLSAGSRGNRIDGEPVAQVSLCGGMTLATGSVPPRAVSAGRDGPSFAPCFATMLYPVQYPQLVGPGPGSRVRRKRRPYSAGPALTRSGTMGSASQTRFVRELKSAPSTIEQTSSEVDDSACAGGAFRLSVRARESRASDNDRDTNRHMFRSIDRTSTGDGTTFSTSTARFTARIRPVDASFAEHNRSRARHDGLRHRYGADEGCGLSRRQPRAAGTQRRNYTNKLSVSSMAVQGNQRGKSLLLDAMARRTCHEARVLVEQNMGAVEEALRFQCQVDATTWSSLCDARTMYRELLETDEGGLSSVAASSGRLESLCSLLQEKGLLPPPSLEAI